MVINFISETKQFMKNAEDYQQIWQELAKRMVDALEKNSGLKFKTDTLEATIYNGPSQSHPLKLRFNYPKDTKKATLVHELGHILLVDNNIKPNKLTPHQLLFLFLYDTWVGLFGKQFADEQVLVEKRRGDKYTDAWEWALAKTESDRKRLLKKEVPDIVY